MRYRLPPGLATTPRDAFLALRARPGVYWLDSGDTAGHHARWHHLGCEPDSFEDIEDAPFEAIGALPLRHQSQDAPPAPQAIACLSYDLGARLEALPVPAGRAPGPRAVLARYPASVSYDLHNGEAWITARSQGAASDLERALASAPTPVHDQPLTTSAPRSDTSVAQWRERIAKALEYIAAGDTYQVNLSHAFRAPTRPDVPPADAYLRLRDRHPACFGAYLDCGTSQILSNSPECFLDVDLRADSRRVATWPLKGTRPRDADPKELAQSAKDRAEHVMIVDLERNDLGRIAVPGTVRVPVLQHVVVHPTVLHLESRVEATPRPGVGLEEVLRASFPGGSITGAPKIRAMEIIAELEAEPRGLYCGALGWIGHDGRSGWSIPIRTAIVENGTLHFRSGGGIVADSNADAEYEETLVKARAFTRTFG